MKVAVVLRGQARRAQLGADLFQKYVVDKNLNHKFDVFIHTTNTETICDNVTEEIAKSRPLNYYDVEVVNKNYCFDNYIKYWKPKKYIIEGTAKFLSTVNKIIDKNNTDIDFKKWLYKNYNNFIDTGVPNIFCGGNDDDYRLRLHALHYMSQHWGASRVYNLLDDQYDLVIQTRPDCLFYFDPGDLQKCLDILNWHEENKEPHINGHVLSNILSVRFGKPLVNDYLYICKPSTIQHWFPNTEQTFFNLFTKNKIMLMDMIGDGQTKFQNLLFLKFGENIEFLKHYDCWEAEIIRPHVNISPEDNLKSVFNKCNKHQSIFRNNRQPVEVDLEPIYEKLLNNDLWLEGSYE